jgi:hypothetical protein
VMPPMHKTPLRRNGLSRLHHCQVAGRLLTHSQRILLGATNA